MAPTSISLVTDGHSEAAIVVAELASPDARRAVENLAKYIERSTGARVAAEKTSIEGRVEIHIGQTDYVNSLNLETGDLETNGFSILFPAPDRIVLIGATESGTEFAIYDFLERYVGVRWLFPDEIGTHVPHLRDIDIPIAPIVSKPSFISRTISNMQASEPGEPIHIWLQRHRRRWTIQHHHNLLNTFDPDRYYDAHPQFYPKKDGKSARPESGTYNWNPVLDADGIVDFAIERINDYFDQNPHATSYSLGINDTNYFDHPAEQMNSVGLGDYSDYYFKWANAVVEGVLKKHPDKWFGCLAYVGITDPPQNQIGVHPRIVPHICIDRHNWASEEHAQRDMKRTQDWHAVAPILGWYDYIYGDDQYRIPRVYPRLMDRYIKFASQNGVKAFYAEYYGSPAWTEGPKMYALMKLLWDPSADVDALLKEWYRLAVGERAATPLAKYFQLWEDYWMNDVPRTDWFKQNADRVYMDFDRTGYLDQLTTQDLDEARRLMDEVVASADSAEHKERAAFLSKGLNDLLRDVEYYVRLRGKKLVANANHSVVYSDAFVPSSISDDKIPQPWGGWQNEPGTARFYWDHGNGHEDSHCVAIDASGGVGNCVIYRDEKVAASDNLYHLRAVMQANGVNADADVGIEVRWRREDGKYIPRKYTANAFRRAADLKDGQWTPVELFVRPPPAEGQSLVMTIYLGTSYANKGTVRFDDVSLTSLKESEIIVEDSSASN